MKERFPFSYSQMEMKKKIRSLAFEKYHGLKNDFVILDILDQEQVDVILTGENLRKLADRKIGIGCDQIMVVLPAKKSDQVTICDARVRIFNSDGSEGEACGNGTRCVVQYLGLKLGKTDIVLDSPSGILTGRIHSRNDVQVQQGKPKMILGENQQPLVLSDYGLPDSPGYAVDVGNPHLVIFLPGPTSEDTVRKLGPRLENHSFFPNRTNVEFCHVIPDDPGSVRVLMWERGAGRTQACGSGACAVAFAAFKTGKVQGGSVRVVMEGGELLVCMDEQGIVSHRGEAQHVFRGVYDMEKED